MAVTKTTISATTYCIASCKNNFLILKQGSGKCASNFPSSMFFFLILNMEDGKFDKMHKPCMTVVCYSKILPILSYKY